MIDKMLEVTSVAREDFTSCGTGGPMLARAPQVVTAQVAKVT